MMAVRIDVIAVAVIIPVLGLVAQAQHHGISPLQTHYFRLFNTAAAGQQPHQRSHAQMPWGQVAQLTDAGKPIPYNNLMSLRPPPLPTSSAILVAKFELAWALNQMIFSIRTPFQPKGVNANGVSTVPFDKNFKRPLLGAPGYLGSYLSAISGGVHRPHGPNVPCPPSPYAQFLTLEQQEALHELITEARTSGANELTVKEHIDRYLAEVLTPDRLAAFSAAYDAFEARRRLHHIGHVPQYLAGGASTNPPHNHGHNHGTGHNHNHGHGHNHNHNHGHGHNHGNHVISGGGGGGGNGGENLPTPPPQPVETGDGHPSGPARQRRSVKPKQQKQKPRKVMNLEDVDAEFDSETVRQFDAMTNTIA